MKTRRERIVALGAAEKLGARRIRRESGGGV